MPISPLLLGGISLGSSLLGGLFGQSERPTLDPNELRRRFGPQAISKEAQELFRMLAQSPAFTQIMQQAAASGQRIGGGVRANLAQRGISGSGVGALQGAATRGFSGALQGQAQQGLFAQALQAALQNVQSRQNAFVGSQFQRQQQPTFGRLIGSGLLGAGAQGFSSLLSGGQPAGSTGGSSNFFDPQGSPSAPRFL